MDFLNIILDLCYYLNKIKNEDYFNTSVQKIILIEQWA